MCKDQLKSLELRHGQLLWNEDATDVEGWLTEREGQLAKLTRHQPEAVSKQQPQLDSSDAVLAHLHVLQQQENFQVCWVLPAIHGV